MKRGQSAHMNIFSVRSYGPPLLRTSSLQVFGSMRYAPMRTRYARPARARQHKPRQSPLKTTAFVTSCATGSVIHSAPAQETELFLCVRSSKTRRTLLDRLAALALARSHKNEFGLLRPPGARPALLALRLISPLALGPQSWGPARWSGRQRLARLDTLSALRGRRSGDRFTAQDVARRVSLRAPKPAGASDPATVTPARERPRAVMPVAGPPKEDADTFRFCRR